MLHRYTTKAVQLCILLCVGGLQAAYAQSFEQRYADWKAKQEAIDAKLTPKSHTTSNLNFSSTTAASGNKISLNKASLAELMQLSGVGEKKAQAIIEYRQQSGAFQKIEDIQKVKGIGPALFEKNKNRLAL